MSGPALIRAAAATDAGSIARIYDHYVRETIITFEEQPVSSAEMATRIEAVQALVLPWLVAEESDRVIGYAYAGAWSSRTAYRFSVESSVYLDPDCTARGVGRALYEALLTALRQTPVHAVIGRIALPNEASVILHEKLGFRKIALFAEIGFKFDRWIDVGCWQLLL